MRETTQSDDKTQAQDPAARVNLRVDFIGGRRLGPGKARLLELVGEHGSISAAGRAMGMSYRRAWLLIDDLNRIFESRLVEAQAGGGGGGGAVLTELGRRILGAYREAERNAALVPALATLAGLLAKEGQGVTPPAPPRHAKRAVARRTSP